MQRKWSKLSSVCKFFSHKCPSYFLNPISFLCHFKWCIIGLLTIGSLLRLIGHLRLDRGVGNFSFYRELDWRFQELKEKWTHSTKSLLSRRCPLLVYEIESWVQILASLVKKSFKWSFHSHWNLISLYPNAKMDDSLKHTAHLLVI